ncbi:NAD-dependent epimerase/dehydratase family protein [Singulisphaera acidiphila]|uniref:Nucleoside-diphosphate-sugar epimerase n=1 Tax=Singulisphaera acidiphila (strain ATCC BAA-1392 / DSM 18658 / VKM B-2454 / MOB10) TaxID=886293 RepID=L0D7B9_SINAD|nr:NAD(P)-dependent oxidoreductase [Singulisphaera acidiphila]AGA24521.1 nucleoside-diphosphate-sugar epimerase [Singulisphaera acidiphila DSM 18658]
MATLITGAEGFLGAQLAHRLHANGQEVVGLDITASSAPRPWPVLIGDVTDRAFIEDLFATHEITNVVHSGGVSGPHICNQFPARVFEVNVLGTLNLFEVARLRGLRGRIVFLSSSSVYGQAAEKVSCETPVVEGLPLLASEPYGSSKVACEAMIRAYVGQDNLDIVALRISIVYGAGRTAYCGITEMLKSALEGKPIVLDRDCDIPLPWVYIDDLCAALQTTLEAPRASIGEADTLAYNVSGPGYPTFREIAGIVQELVPGTTVREGDAPDKYAMNARKMSLTAIKRDLGWEPRVTVRDGVAALHKSLIAKPT